MFKELVKREPNLIAGFWDAFLYRRNLYRDEEQQQALSSELRSILVVWLYPESLVHCPCNSEWPINQEVTEQIEEALHLIKQLKPPLAISMLEDHRRECQVSLYVYLRSLLVFYIQRKHVDPM